VPAGDLDLRTAVDALERKMVTRALREHNGNQTHAARALGLSRFGLQKKLKRLHIELREVLKKGAP
jgi:transcriptional regulator with GAF, ATPase, and Fis domain